MGRILLVHPGEGYLAGGEKSILMGLLVHVGAVSTLAVGLSSGFTLMRTTFMK